MSEDVAELDGERLAWMYRQMLRIREFEERVKATFTEHPGVIRGRGQVVLCFFGDGASKQGAFAESLNVASLWKLPVVYVLENNAYNVVTRVEQEDANAAAGGVPRRGGIRGGAAGRSLAAPA
jgi:TPP-dependent pyruvate/acetoin dehydrogenase alpha subunit